MQPTTRCKEYRLGQKGRLRSYVCRNCGERFSQVLLRALPKKARLCTKCLKIPGLNAQYHEAFEKRDRREAK
ncbi:hypothetical protein LCGC14_1705870 [marine sediment metagenome]|uniref:Uncharacterized protein n=1 Tax=marine sediment metagenome TaxID=412755 RepID=A0A0F9JX15_9ZZZZ